jgi:8-hydroxy-5-deazaflavin:NADPH oxidoreductase
MAIGIIGAGRIGSALASHLTRAGYEVVLANSRGPASLAQVVAYLGSNARAGTSSLAAAQPVVILAVKWANLPDIVQDLPSISGKIVIDASNPYLEKDGQLVVADLEGRTSSEIVAELLVGAKLVKAFNTLLASVLAADPKEAGGRRVIFLSGDHEDAKAEVRSIISAVGWAPLDLGSLATGGRLQQARGPLAGANLIRMG